MAANTKLMECERSVAGPGECENWRVPPLAAAYRLRVGAFRYPVATHSYSAVRHAWMLDCIQTSVYGGFTRGFDGSLTLGAMDKGDVQDIGRQRLGLYGGSDGVSHTSARCPGTPSRVNAADRRPQRLQP